MGYSTTIKLAYGFDGEGFPESEALQDEGMFNELAHQLGIGHLVELDSSGDARSETFPVVVLKKHQRNADVNGVTYVSELSGPSQVEKDALEKLVTALGIEVSTGWILYGNVW